MNPAQTWFRLIVRFRVAVLLLCAASIVAGGVGAAKLTKDTSADAFIDPQNAALQYRKRVESQFGVTDPIVIAIFAKGVQGIYEPAVLELVRSLSESVSGLPLVDPARTKSIATEKWIRGTVDGMEVEPLLPGTAVDTASATRLRAAIADSALYRGALVSADGRATLIVAELLHEKTASDAYAAVVDLVGRQRLPSGVEIHVAGEGAITGHLSHYIDADARRMIPIALLVIVGVLFAAFRTVRGALVPMLVVLGTILCTLGIMGASGVSYFAITSGMVVALIGIAVADSIHIFNDYYQRLRREPQRPNGEIVVATMTAMLRPVSLTTLTTMAGFLTLWPTNSMPPIRWFGVFGATGVALAWLYTVTLLPAILAVLPRQIAPSIDPSRHIAADRSGWLMQLGHAVIRHPVATLVLAASVCGVGFAGLSRLQVDYSRIDNFSASSPLHRADRAINANFQGGYHLDVVVTGETDESLYEPTVLKRIELLQRRMSRVQGVGGSISIVDYVRQMNRAVNAGASEYDRLPESRAAVAQLFLLYTLSADPTDFETEIDSSRREALVRFRLNTPRWSDHARIVEELERQVAELFPVAGARAAITGRVMVDHVWMQGIRDSHFASVAVSILAVLAMCVVLFRSAAIGLACLVPVALAVLGVYAVMGFGQIWLGVATSMFASVAIGLGIDFAIHTLDRARQLRGESADIRVLHAYQSTGRPLLFNALAVVLGFGVVMLSEVPPVQYFGALVAAGVAAAFLASLTALPAAMVLYMRRRQRTVSLASARSAVAAGQIRCGLAIAALFVAAPLAGPPAMATDAAASELMRRVHTRPEGRTRAQTVRVELTDRRGVTRIEETRLQRLVQRDGVRRTRVEYLAPVNVRGTAFLTVDHVDASRDDDSWLYLPALRKVRRLPAADRGDSFFGTDLSYEEIKNDGRPDPADWEFTARGFERVDGVECVVVEGRPASVRVAAELGFSRGRWCVETGTLISRRTEFWDANGNALKVVSTLELSQIEGIWVAARIIAVNLKTGHRTVLGLRDIVIDAPMDTALFTQQRLTRGP